jgi:hypothetical protein
MVRLDESEGGLMGAASSSGSGPDVDTQNLQAVQKILRIVAALPQPQRTHVLIAAGQAVGVHLAVKATA